MSKSSNKVAARVTSGVVEIKSKFDAEFRRIGISRQKLPGFKSFTEMIVQIHGLRDVLFTIWYTDPEGDLLPISNSENFARALAMAEPLLRIVIQRKGQAIDPSSYGAGQKKQKFGLAHHRQLAISFPEDFRRVSAIIDVDIVPECHRRVRLMKNSSDKPLGFYIRDGTSIRVLPHGLEKVPGIFISRLVAGGLAESTGLLAVNDEVLEVNGIEVSDKTLDQVTDMMVANSSNLIITIKPVNSHNNIKSRPDVTSVGSQGSHKSGISSRQSESCEVSHNSDDAVNEDEDFVEDHTLLADDHPGSSILIHSRLTNGEGETGVITL